jgi:hypothetical protein
VVRLIRGDGRWFTLGLAMVAATKLPGASVRVRVPLAEFATTHGALTEADLAFCLDELRERFSLLAGQSW